MATPFTSTEIKYPVGLPLADQFQCGLSIDFCICSHSPCPVPFRLLHPGSTPDQDQACVREEEEKEADAFWQLGANGRGISAFREGEILILFLGTFGGEKRSAFIRLIDLRSGSFHKTPMLSQQPDGSLKGSRQTDFHMS